MDAVKCQGCALVYASKASCGPTSSWSAPGGAFAGRGTCAPFPRGCSPPFRAFPWWLPFRCGDAAAW
eukprot:2039574-Heterocapsa_arctica.AAC.1